MRSGILCKIVFFLALAIVRVQTKPVEDGDTQVTRVKSLTEEEKRLPVPREKTRSIYLVNLLPVPNDRTNQATNTDQDNTLTDSGRSTSVPGGPGRRPTLFLLQKVEDNGRLPDGIYYRPAEGESETPPPVFQKVIMLLKLLLYRITKANINVRCDL